MEALPRGLAGSPGRDSRADDDKSEGECSSLSSLGLSPIVSPQRIRRPRAAGRRGRNMISPVSASAGSDSGSDRIPPNEQGSPALVPSIDAIAGMRSLPAEIPASTNPQTPDEAGCSEAHKPTSYGSESASLTSNNHSSDSSKDTTSTDRKDYTNEEGYEVDTVEGEWLLTRSGNDLPSDEHVQQAGSTPAQETPTQVLVEIDQEADSARRAMPTPLDQRLSDETNTTRASADLRKLLRQFFEVKHERDQVAEENITLRIENERLGNELCELTTVSHKHLQSSLIQDEDLKLAEEAAEEARAERDRSKESVLRMSEEVRKIKQENSKLDIELKSSSHEIWRLKGELDKSERELQTFQEAESSPQTHSNRLGRAKAEADNIMTWMKKEKDQQSRLYPKLTQFHSRHLLTLLNGTRARSRPPSFLPSPVQFHSLGDVISTTSEAYPSNRQSMVSQLSLPVLTRKHQSESTVPLPAPAHTARTRSVHDCDPCRQQCYSYKRERAARTWTSHPRNDRTVSVGKLQLPLSTTDIIGASLSKPPTRIPIPILQDRTERGTRTYKPSTSVIPAAQLSRQYDGLSKVRSSMGTDLEVSRSIPTDTANGVTHQATSSAVELPQSPGLKKRVSSSPQTSPISPVEIQPLRLSRRTEKLDGSDVEANTSSPKIPIGRVESEATREITFDNIAENGTQGEQQLLIAGEPGAPKNGKLASVQHQTLPLRQGNALPTELRHRRPYSWDGAVHQSSSPHSNAHRNDSKQFSPVNGDAMVGDETMIPGTVVDYAPLKRDTHSSTLSNVLYSDSTSVSRVSSEADQHEINDTRIDELPPTPSLASASSHSGFDNMSLDELKAYQDKKLNPDSARNPRILHAEGWPWENKVYHPLFSRVRTNLDSLVDRFENAPSQALEVLFEPGLASLGLSDIYFQSEAFELHLDDEDKTASAGQSTPEMTTSDQDGSHLIRGVLMSGKHSKETYVDSSTDWNLDLADGRPSTVLDNVNVYRFISESPIQYCNDNDNILDKESEAVSSSQSDDHESLLPSPLRPSTFSGTNKTKLSPDNNKSVSDSTTNSLSTPVHSHQSGSSVGDRGPTYFLLALFLVYISLGTAFVLFTFVAPLAVTLPGVVVGGLTWILTSVRTLSVMAICGNRHPTASSTSPMFLMSSSLMDETSRNTLTSFESAITHPVSGRGRGRGSETIKAGFPWTLFEKDEEFVSIFESEGSITLSRSTSGKDETKRRSVSTVVCTSVPSSPSTSLAPFQIVENSRTTAMTPKERGDDQTQTRGDETRDEPTSQTKVDRGFAFSGPQYLDFTPSIRRFIDIVTFDITVMMMNWDEFF